MAQISMTRLNNYFEIAEADNGSAVWRYFNSLEGPTWKVYVEDGRLARQIRCWQGVQAGAVYFAGNGKKVGEDYIVPKKLLRRALKLIGIQLTRGQASETQLTNLKHGVISRWKSEQNSPVKARSQADPMFDTSLDTGTLIGQNFASKVKVKNCEIRAATACNID